MKRNKQSTSEKNPGWGVAAPGDGSSTSHPPIF